MAWFTSTRERRLWGWALAVLAAIQAAAVFAGALVEAIGSAALLGAAFAAGFALAIAAGVGIALGRRPPAEAWVALGVAATFLMIPVRSGVPALERTHLFEYGLLAVLIYEALTERKAKAGAAHLPAVTAIVAAALLGWMDEALQGLVPGRVYDLRDVALNALAALVAVTAVAGLRWGRARSP